jgi:hypothetical protein
MEALFPAVLIALVGIPVVLAIARHAQNLDSNMGPAAWGAFTRVRFTAGRPRRIVCRMGRGQLKESPGTHTFGRGVTGAGVWVLRVRG